MGRTVSALVTWGDTYLGAIGPFPVSVPWWADVEPVVAHLRAVLDVPVLVLRLLTVEGGEGARDGHVTYHVAALDRPAPGLLAERPVDHIVLNGPEELRTPWARLESLNEMLTWASDTLAATGRPMTGAAEQQRTWNLSGLFRLPTGQGPVWLKATPRFATDEASVIAAFARVDPALVPPVIAAGPRRVLLEHLPGEDCWDASPQIITSAIQRLAAAQAILAGQPASLPPGLPDRRTPVIAGQVSALLDGPVASELSAGEVAAARGLLSRFPLLDECGPPLPGPGSMPGHRASRVASRPARYASPNRSPTSPTPCATKNSSTASSPRNGSTTPAIPQPLSVPRSAAQRIKDSR